MKFVQNLTTVLLLLMMLFFGWVAFMGVARDIIRSRANQEAQAFCMQWKIKESAMIDGVRYCRMEVNYPFIGGGGYLTAPQWYSEEEMVEMNGKALKDVKP